MDLDDVLGEWRGERGDEVYRVLIERGSVSLRRAGRVCAAMDVAEVVPRAGELALYGEGSGEDVTVVIKRGERGLELSWLDGIYPFGVALSRDGSDRQAEAEAAFEALMREVGRGWDDDNPFAPGPRPGPRREQLAAFGADACPLLIAALGSESRRRREEAARVLVMLGEGATPAALEALGAAAVRHPEQLGRWLYRVDPSAGRRLGVQRAPETWRAIFDDCVEQDVEAAGGLLAELLGERETAALILGEEVRHHAAIDRVAKARPDLVPLARLRALLEDPEPALSAAAGAWLRHLKCPSALQAALEGPAPCSWAFAQLLGGWAGSERLLETAPEGGERARMRGLAELLLRRRAAGLSVPVARLKPVLLQALRDGRDEWTLGHALTAAQALDDADLDALAESVRPRLRRSVDDVRRSSLRGAEDAFTRGLCDAQVLFHSAFRGYAGVLLRERSPRAAFQLAWIDRAFGTPATPARVQWIRDLGFRDEGLLAELTRPLAHPLPGRRGRWKPSSVISQRHIGLRLCHARLLESVGLPGAAAAVYASIERRRGHHAGDRERCTRLASEHLVRVADACAV